MMDNFALSPYSIGKIQISLESTSTVRWTLPSSVWWMTFSPFASLAKQTITISLESTSKMYNPRVVYYGDSHLCLLISNITISETDNPKWCKFLLFIVQPKRTSPSGVQFPSLFIVPANWAITHGA